MSSLMNLTTYDRNHDLRVGTWYNGYPVYRRTIVLISPADRNFSTNYANVLSDITIPGDNWIVNMFGVLKNDTDWILLPFVSSNSNYSISIYIDKNRHPVWIYGAGWTAEQIVKQKDGAMIVDYVLPQ